MQLPKADLGGGVQHGRCGGGKLRVDPGGGSLVPTTLRKVARRDVKDLLEEMH